MYQITDNDLEKLKNQLKYVIERSEFYQKKFADLDISPENIFDKFSSLPFTTKKELLESQENYPPYGNYLATDPVNLCRIHKTSGTTNKPLLVALSKKDTEITTDIGAKSFRHSGLRETDTVVHCLSYNMWAGGYTDHHSLEKTGATVIPFGVGHSKNLIEIILRIKPTAIHCTPSYLAKLQDLLKSEFNMKPEELSLKLGLFGAEPGLQDEAFRANIEKVWQLKAMNANYGLSDVFSLFGAESEKQDGLYFTGAGVLYPELIDRKSGETVLPSEGVEGELVLTNLVKESQPLIRYRTNDVIRVKSVAPSGEFERGFRFEVVGRSDDMFVVKGVNVFANAISAIITERLDVLTGQHQIHINKTDPVDKIKIRIEKNKNIDLPSNFEISLAGEFKNRLNISPVIEILQDGDLPRTEGKTKKLFRSL